MKMTTQFAVNGIKYQTPVNFMGNYLNSSYEEVPEKLRCVLMELKIISKANDVIDYIKNFLSDEFQEKNVEDTFRLIVNYLHNEKFTDDKEIIIMLLKFYNTFPQLLDDLLQDNLFYSTLTKEQKITIGELRNVN